MTTPKAPQELSQQRRHARSHALAQAVVAAYEAGRFCGSCWNQFLAVTVDSPLGKPAAERGGRVTGEG